MPKADGSFENGDLCVLGCFFCRTEFDEAQALGSVIECPNPNCPYTFVVRRIEPEAEPPAKLIGTPKEAGQ